MSNSGIIGVNTGMNTGILSGSSSITPSTANVTSRYPAFRVSITADYDHSAGSIIQMSKDTNSDNTTRLYNAGGYYNTSTYKFKAPVTGLYSLYCQILFMSSSNPEDYSNCFFIMQNSNRISYAFRRARYVGDDTGTGGYYGDCTYNNTFMNAGDEAWIQCTMARRIHANLDYTYFTGHLISDAI